MQRSAAPDGFGDRALEERRDDELRPEQRDRFLGDAIVDVEFDRNVVARFAQLDEQPLREAVERMGKQQDRASRTG